jgi:hypothetical protein
MKISKLKEKQDDMKIWNSKLLVLSSVLALAVTAAGCAVDNKTKELMTQALVKQQDMKAYSFTGTADLNLEAPAAAQGQNPITGSIVGMLTKGKLQWSGASTLEPVRLEANIKSTPAGSSSSLELPVILKDNKLYLHIPVLNKQDEFYSIDMKELGQLSGSGQSNPVSADSLKNINKTAADSIQLLIADIDPKWFSKPESVTLKKDGSKATLYRLNITEKNSKELADSIRSKLPQVQELVRNSGLVTPGQTAAPDAKSGSFELKAPGKVEAVVDETGFIREQTLQLTFQATGADGTAHTNSIAVTQAYDDINQEPKFSQEEPKNVRPLSEILKLLVPSSAAKK